MADTLKVGTVVKYRGCWGDGAPTVAEIQGIELCKEGEKYGRHANEISFDRKDECVFDLDDNHWCYGYQIDSIVTE